MAETVKKDKIKVNSKPAEAVEPEVETRIPAVDIAESDSGVIMWFEVPGAKAATVNIEVNDSVLSVEAASSLKTDGRPLVFKREFQLSDGADVGGIEAKTADGVLTLTIPKSDRAKVHKIQVG